MDGFGPTYIALKSSTVSRNSPRDSPVHHSVAGHPSRHPNQYTAHSILLFLPVTEIVAARPVCSLLRMPQTEIIHDRRGKPSASEHGGHTRRHVALLCDAEGLVVKAANAMWGMHWSYKTLRSYNAAAHRPSHPADTNIQNRPTCALFVCSNARTYIRGCVWLGHRNHTSSAIMVVPQCR